MKFVKTMRFTSLVLFLACAAIFTQASDKKGGSISPLVDCDHQPYSSFTSKDLFLGHTMIGAKSAYTDEVVIAFSEGFPARNLAADSVVQVAGWSVHLDEDLFARWASEPLETRMVMRKANGYAHLTIHLLGPNQRKFELAVDAFGCGAKIRREHGLDSENYVEVQALSRHGLRAMDRDLDQAVRDFLNQPLVVETEKNLETLSWSYCGHGGPGSLSCSVSLPFGLGCSIECGPGTYSCCNSFGGCSCRISGGDSGCDGGVHEDESLCQGCTWECVEDDDGNLIECVCL